MGETIYIFCYPDTEAIMRQLADKLKDGGLDAKFGYLQGMPIIDDEDERTDT